MPNRNQYERAATDDADIVSAEFGITIITDSDSPRFETAVGGAWVPCLMWVEDCAAERQPGEGHAIHRNPYAFTHHVGA